MNDILKTYDVSRETLDKLKHFEKLVLEWNEKFNLISKKSATDIWCRHILDSAQLFQFLKPEDKILCDFGSGAGFPAIVLAVMSEEKLPDLKLNLIESITKKTTFLKSVKEELSLQNVTIVCDRIENLKMKNIDIISSRAMASLDKLLEYSSLFCTSKTRLVFPKGVKWEEEIKEAQKKWSFDCKTQQSQTEDEARILYISNIRRKKW